MVNVPPVRLNNGHEMPLFGLGTYNVSYYMTLYLTNQY